MLCVVRLADVCLPCSVDALLIISGGDCSKQSVGRSFRLNYTLIIYRRRVLCRAIYYILYSSPAFMRKNRFTEMYAQMAVMKMPKSSTAQPVMANTCQVMMLSIFSW